jgi:hypothetical protein
MVVVPDQTDVRLTYGTTGVEWLAWALTAAGLVGLVLLLRAGPLHLGPGRPGAGTAVPAEAPSAAAVADAFDERVDAMVGAARTRSVPPVLDRVPDPEVRTPAGGERASGHAGGGAAAAGDEAAARSAAGATGLGPGPVAPPPS